MIRDKKPINLDTYSTRFDHVEIYRLHEMHDHSLAVSAQLETLIMRYVRGDSFDDIRAIFIESIRYLLKTKAFYSDIGGAYPNLGGALKIELYPLIAFAYGLGLDDEQWGLLTRDLLEPEGIDWALDSLIAQRSPERAIADVNVWRKTAQSRRFGLLHDIIVNTNRARASAIEKQLKKWHSNRNKATYRGHVAYGNKYSEEFNYVGNFAFEIAAVVMAFDIDDSPFCEDIYYPKELVEHWRENFRGKF